METLLEERQLIDCIRREADEIPEIQATETDTAQVKAQKETKLAERKLLEAGCKLLLVEKIADSQLEYFKVKSTPKSIWATLQNLFAKMGISGQFYLLKQLFHSEAKPMEEHLLRFERIIRELASADIVMHERLVVFNLLQTMPKSFPDRVCKLNKSIYGLKQASKAWNDYFHEFATRIGFRRSESDSCLYVCERDGEKVFLLMYVDDILVVSRSLGVIGTIKKLLKSEFSMQDMGEAKMFLGLKINRDVLSGRMRLSQEHYTKSILKRFEMEKCKPVSTPMEAGLQLVKNDTDEKLEKPYRELIGCLTYLMVTSRPDLSAAVNYFSQFQSNPSEDHWVHAKRILRYLQGTADHGLVYNRSTGPIRQVTGYADANWATDINDRRSVSGILFKLYGVTVCWSTRKQSTVSLSSTEAECSALADAACEAIWIGKVLEDLGVLEAQPTLLYEDNQSTIAIMESAGPSKRLKHTDVKIHFVRECVASKKLEVRYIPKGEQQADLLTKGLSTMPFRKHCSSIGVFPRSV